MSLKVASLCKGAFCQESAKKDGTVRAIPSVLSKLAQGEINYLKIQVGFLFLPLGCHFGEPQTAASLSGFQHREETSGIPYLAYKELIRSLSHYRLSGFQMNCNIF